MEKNDPSELTLTATNSSPLITMRGLTRMDRVHHGPEFTALKNISFEVWPGEFIAIMGPSDSGKSALMNLLSCQDTPTYGDYIIDGKRHA